MSTPIRSGIPVRLSSLILALVCLGFAGCNGADGAAGPPGVSSSPKTTPKVIETDLDRHQDLPGLNAEIVSLSGGSGPNGNFRPGDFLSVTYTLKLNDGTVVSLDQVSFGGILASGPTSNYNPILAYQRNLLSASIDQGNGTYVYTFAAPIPATYLPPLNDTASFGAVDGELQGQALLDGTYTVGIEAYKLYKVAGESIRDAAATAQNFLLGNATTIEAREVVTQANCNQCHDSIRAHGTFRRSIANCLLCHTSGAEDKNVASAAGGTPGVTIDFKVMIHRIHSGEHLPSVLGVTTNADGSRKYDATPRPYRVVGYQNSVHDFSDVGFSVWPNLSDPLPRDAGYSKLSRAEQALEDTMRRGPADCAKCHGDPDGAGPLAAPAQGGNAYSKPTMAACGSCHDDIEWTKPYDANLFVMPPQHDNATCSKCHPAEGAPLAVKEGHVHPLLDEKLNKGLVFELLSVAEAGKHNNSGALDPNEKVAIKFAVKDESGQPVDISTLGRMELVIAGPTSNRNILLEEQFPYAAFKGSTVETLVPQKRFLEYLGDAKLGGGGKFVSAGPHWNAVGATTSVWVRKSAARLGGSPLAKAAAVGQNYCDVVSGKVFTRGDYIVLDDGNANEEYLRVQYVDGNRLWFSSTHSPYDQPYTRNAHQVAATVAVVELVKKVAGKDYTLDPKTGTITEVIAFGADLAVLTSYTSDFVVPETYPAALNESPDQDVTWGKWKGLSLLDGTYSVGLWGERDIQVKVWSETTSYHATSRAATADFLVGKAKTLTRSNVISSANNCYSCHNDIRFHGAHRRGYAACMMCHGTAGAEDRPPYVAANAPKTPGVSIDFRRMLHKIHMGKDLANKSTYAVVGYGFGYPNNYTAHKYDQVGFPTMPGGAKNCAACHGAKNDAWQLPTTRNHPAQTRDTLAWTISCGSCHDSSATHAHFAVQTTSKGAESCAVCHGKGKDWSVELMHKLHK